MNQSSPRKYIVLLTAGEKPTVPVPSNLSPVDINWKSTDIMIGQSAYNVVDKKWYIRDSRGITESTDQRFKDVGDSLTQIYAYINGQTSGLPSYFQIMNEGLPNEYLRLKKPLGCDYDIQAYTNSGQFPLTIWESLPYASDLSIGGIKYNPDQFELNNVYQLTLKGGVVTPTAHTHSWSDITSGVPTEYNPSTHGLISDRHSASGLTAGHFLRATSASAYDFLALTKEDITNLLADWFVIAGTAPNQYIRCKYPFASDYEIQAYTNSGQLPSTIWESMPMATSTSIGGIILNTAQFEYNSSNQLTIKDGIIAPKEHTHSIIYQPNGLNGFVYTDNAGNLFIDGNIIQNGSTYETHAEQVYTKNNTIILRDEAVAGLAVGEYAGLVAKMYDGVNDGLLIYDKDGIARVGDAGSLQPLTTRIETPSNGYFAYWESPGTRLNFKQIAKTDIPSTVVYTDQANVFGDYAQSFKDNILRIYNPANTYYYTLTAGAIAANRILNFPVLTATDTIVTENHTQTLTNKTISATGNTVLAEWFEIVNAGQSGEYLRVKKPLGCDYDIQAYTNSGQFPLTIWESLPIASTTSFGIVKIGSGINVTNGLLSVASGAGMVYPGAGIALSTGSAWGASIANNSENWNTAYTYSQVGHLPLGGGTMANTNLVSNLNADLLDGQQGSYYAVASIYPATGLSTGYLPYKSLTSLSNSPIYTNGTSIGLGTTDIEAWSTSYKGIEFASTAIMGGVSNSSLLLTANAYYDGDWKYKATSTAGVFSVDDTYLSYRQAVSGTVDTKITWTTPFQIDVDGNSIFTGNMAVGTTISDYHKLRVSISPTDSLSGSSVFSCYGYPTYTGAETASESYYGFRAYLYPIINTDHNNSGSIISSYVSNLRNSNDASADDNGTLASLVGSQITYGHYLTNSSATPITTTAYGLYIVPNYRTGTITNMFDIYLAGESTGGTATNRWGIYQANSKNNKLEGSLGLGITPTEKLHVSGNILATGEVTAYYSSDIRLKKNIVDFSGITIIEQLAPKMFNWNNTAKKLNTQKNDTDQYGVIAQELEQVLPGLVHPIYGKYKSVDYIQLIPILIQGIKELKQEITELKMTIK